MSAPTLIPTRAPTLTLKTQRLLSDSSVPGIVTTVGGIAGKVGYSGEGVLATTAQLNNPRGVTVDVKGNIYIADTGNHIIRVIDVAGYITTVAGIPQSKGYSGDGLLANKAQLSSPQGVAVDTLEDIYIADTGNKVIRVISKSTGIITTFSFRLLSFVGIAFDPNGVWRASDGYSEVWHGSEYAACAGTGYPGYTGNAIFAKNSMLNAPHGVAIDTNNNIYIADTGNHLLRVIDAYGGLDTVVGTYQSPGYSGDGLLANQAQRSSHAYRWA